MEKVYLYVVDRDLGFAPNPFHGICTLATCKPKIRNTAKIGDWVFGIGGGRLKATGKCIFAMKVTKKITFNEYWSSLDYQDKKPVRNGSKRMLVGDNIYYHDEGKNIWHQAHSHHSLPGGGFNEYNFKRDTQSNFVLISEHFFYFGSSAPKIPSSILTELDYKNQVGHRKYNLATARQLVNWIEENYSNSLNLVLGDPFNFDKSEAHYSVNTNKITD